MKKFYNKLLILSLSIIVQAQNLLQAQTTSAQVNQAFSQATNDLKLYFNSAVKVMYVIVAIMGLIGAVKVYNKFTNGDPDTSKTAASWFGACIFAVISVTILKAFFGIS